MLPKRIELLASPLPRECSTTELRQRSRVTVKHRCGDGGSFAIALYSTQDQKGPINRPTGIDELMMAKSEQALQREQRLAAKLRENLKRRKDQSRARVSGRDAGPQILAPETDTEKKP